MSDWHDRARTAYQEHIDTEREALRVRNALSAKKLAAAVEAILGCDVEPAWPSVTAAYQGGVTEFGFMDDTNTIVGVRWYCAACVNTPLFPINALSDIGALIIKGTPPHKGCDGTPIFF